MANNTGKKFGGRKKGTPNKLTKELRIVLKDLIYYELEGLEERLNNLSDQDRIEFIIKLIPYVLPKLEKINHSNNEPTDWFS